MEIAIQYQRKYRADLGYNNMLSRFLLYGSWLFKWKLKIAVGLPVWVEEVVPVFATLLSRLGTHPGWCTRKMCLLFNMTLLKTDSTASPCFAYCAHPKDSLHAFHECIWEIWQVTLNPATPGIWTTNLPTAKHFVWPETPTILIN